MAAPLWQKRIDAGRITTSGWASHWAGGGGRMLGYVVGTDMDAITQATQAYIEEVTTQHPTEAAEFNSICPSHDDRIWYVCESSQAPDDVAEEHGRRWRGLEMQVSHRLSEPGRVSIRRRDRSCPFEWRGLLHDRPRSILSIQFTQIHLLGSSRHSPSPKLPTLGRSRATHKPKASRKGSLKEEIL